jgi:hypothetical protein
MRKTIKNLSQESWSFLVKNTNVVAPKHKAALLTTQPQTLMLMLGFCEDSNEPWAL